jgi:hypothetical protein
MGELYFSPTAAACITGAMAHGRDLDLIVRRNAIET